MARYSTFTGSGESGVRPRNLRVQVENAIRTMRRGFPDWHRIRVARREYRVGHLGLDDRFRIEVLLDAASSSVGGVRPREVLPPKCGSLPPARSET